MMWLLQLWYNKHIIHTEQLITHSGLSIEPTYWRKLICLSGDAHMNPRDWYIPYKMK